VAHIRLETKDIVDWPSFHEVCRSTFGFPDFYGRNMDAWIDCLTYLRNGDGMSRFHLAPAERLHIEVVNGKKFQKRMPRIAEKLEKCSAIVNKRQVEMGQEPVLSLEYR